MRRWWLRLLPYARPEKAGLCIIVLLVFSGVAVQALMPWPLKLIVDYVLLKSDLPDSLSFLVLIPGADSTTGLLAWLSAGTVLLFIAYRTLHTLRIYFQAGVGNRMAYHLGGSLFEQLQRLSLRFHGRSRVGDLARRVTTDSSCVRELVIGLVVPMVGALTSLAVMFAILWKLHPTLAVIAILVGLPLALVIKLTARRMTERTYAEQELQGQVMALTEQTLSALPMVKAFVRETIEDERFRKLSNETIQAHLSTLSSQLQFKAGVNGTTAVGAALIMLFGGHYVLDGSLTVGSLLVCMSYVVALYGPLESLAYLSEGFAAAAARARRVFEVLDAEDAVSDAPDAVPLNASPAKGHIRLENVSFGYEAGRPVLAGVNLEAQPGELVALVGHTGSGKTTLASLIPRFFDPWEGRVILDGIDVRRVRLEELRSQVAVVLQEPLLFPATVAENIAYGRPDASEAEITAAAVAANADAFIRELPEGYQTRIGERGATLSGGEKQRQGDGEQN